MIGSEFVDFMSFEQGEGGDEGEDSLELAPRDGDFVDGPLNFASADATDV